jgi:hypothetical protein
MDTCRIESRLIEDPGNPGRPVALAKLGKSNGLGHSAIPPAGKFLAYAPLYLPLDHGKDCTNQVSRNILPINWGIERRFAQLLIASYAPYNPPTQRYYLVLTVRISRKDADIYKVFTRSM